MLIHAHTGVPAYLGKLNLQNVTECLSVKIEPLENFLLYSIHNQGYVQA